MSKIKSKNDDFFTKIEKEQNNNLVSEKMFTLGVCTVMTKVFLFASYPQYFFLFCLIQAPFFFFMRFNLSWRKKQALYFMEWCWPVNLLGWSYLALEAASVFGNF
jgi:hypothetical protein